MMPELDVRESSDSITIEAELPGVEEKDVTVTLANGLLTIKGEKKQEKEEKSASYHITERSFGSFQRSLRLPDTVDDSKVEARFEKGVLKVTAAKKPEAVKAERRIEIKTNLSNGTGAAPRRSRSRHQMLLLSVSGEQHQCTSTS